MYILNGSPPKTQFDARWASIPDLHNGPANSTNMHPSSRGRNGSITREVPVVTMISTNRHKRSMWGGQNLEKNR